MSAKTRQICKVLQNAAKFVAVVWFVYCKGLFLHMYLTINTFIPVLDNHY